MLVATVDVVMTIIVDSFFALNKDEHDCHLVYNK